MTTTNRLQQLQSRIGQEFSDSPSPFMRWLRAKVIAAERGHTLLEIEVRGEMTNPAGLLHGGMIAAIHDEVIGLTNACLGSDQFFVTTDLSAKFLKPARGGDFVRAEAKIIKEGRTVVFAESYLFNLQGEMLSIGNATLYLPQKA
jgi:acyl-coenzyme A thioesterase 13